MAELAANENDPKDEFGDVAASLAVLAGIAAADAACCKSLGERSRGQSHHDAEALLDQIAPGGPGAARDLRELINLKEAAQYGLEGVNAAQMKRALRRAESLIDFARRVIEG